MKHVYPMLPSYEKGIHMTNSILTSMIVLMAVAFQNNAYAQTTYIVDTNRSSVTWIGAKIVGSGHHGTIDLQSGRIQVNEGKLTRGQFSIDMNSIKNIDITSESNRTRLVNHLKSDDFFSVSTYPNAQFVLTEATEQKEGTWQISGNLTIKGQSHPIAFPATVTFNDDTATAKAKLSFDRAKYDVRYNSGRFFDPKRLGDNLINDNIDIELDLVATKQEPREKGSQRQRRPKKKK